MSYFTTLYLANSSIVNIGYTLLVSIITIFIFFKVNKLYRLSSHRGIKLFGFAFLFFSISFFINFLISLFANFIFLEHLFLSAILSLLFIYFISLSGFYLVYSLVWKHVEMNPSKYCLKSKSLHLVALGIAILCFIFIDKSIHILFLPQLAVIGYAIFLSYKNYVSKPEHKFRQMYFIAMILWFLGFLINYINSIIMNRYEIFSLYVEIITLLLFMLFLYGVLTITRKNA